MSFRSFGKTMLVLALIAFSGRLPAEGKQIAYSLTLIGGKTATVYTDGSAVVYSVDPKTGRKGVQFTRVRPMAHVDDTATGVNRATNIATALDSMRLPNREQAALQLNLALQRPDNRPFAPQMVIAVFRPGTIAAKDVMTADPESPAAGVPQYTNDGELNRTLASLGVDRSERLFRQISRSMLESMYAGSSHPNGSRGLDFANAYLLHVANASERQAIAQLRKLPSVAYASLDWYVGTMNTDVVPIPHGVLDQAEPQTARMSGPGNIPPNGAVSFSAQSLLNAPGVDAVAAFDEIGSRFHQLPGQGEIITNVSLGDLDDTDNDECSWWAQNYGPTTVVIAGQRYIDWPTMPLIPTYTADKSGNLNGLDEVCGVDPGLGEVGLDFSVMAPLPDQNQRPGRSFAGKMYKDLLGIAPGAQYRLVVPEDPRSTISDIQAAFLGAALQNPRPNVITASLGYGYDVYGFPTRYLEEDPLTESIVTAIVQFYHVVVCMAGGDGTRTFTDTAIGPSGGSAPTRTAPPGGTETDLNDIAFSTAPSVVGDSGSIDVGGTTLDDVFANPPQFTVNPSARAQHAYAETRWTGPNLYSSGYGSRVNVAAPGDAILAFSHNTNSLNAGAVFLGLEGGTSASAPETAAAVAVALQVARLTHHPLTDPAAVRSLLESTGSAIPGIPQADAPLAMGRQINVRNIVEALLLQAGITGQSAVPRVAVEQRQSALFGPFAFDTEFLTGTDTTAIDLKDGYNLFCIPFFCPARPTGENSFAPITIAPDWEFVPAGARYYLIVDSTKRVLARTPWARLFPSEILEAAGLTLAGTGSRTVTLTYKAMSGGRPLAENTFSLTFGPSEGTMTAIPAPQVPPVVDGATIPIRYDLSRTRGLVRPALLVSDPGRMTPIASSFFPEWSMLLTGATGTVDVPVALLQGGGIYGVMIVDESDPHGILNELMFGRVAFTRVASHSAASARPAAPLLAQNGLPGGHFLEFPYKGSFQLTYDVTGVPGATGAVLEIGAGGLTNFGLLNTFNNPNGSIRDNDLINTGSVYYAPLPGTRGTLTLDGKSVGLIPSLNHVVRVVPTKNGAAAGEASDVSTIIMDGIAPPDGHTVHSYGLNRHGADAVIATGVFCQAPTCGGGHLFTFDQPSGSITAKVRKDGQWFLDVLGGGIFGAHDLGLISSNLVSPVSFFLMDPVTGGKLGGTWTPPESVVVSASVNSSTQHGAFLTLDAAYAHQIVFGSDIAHNTFSPTVDLGSRVNNGSLDTIDEDTTTHTALVGGNDATAPEAMAVDFGTGAVRNIPLPSGCGLWVGQVAIDSLRRVAAMVCASGNSSLGFYDMNAGTEIWEPLRGAMWVAADQNAGKFLVGGFDTPALGTAPPPDPVTDPLGIFDRRNSDDNGLSAVRVYDEQGRMLETIERFSLFGTFFFGDNLLQVNPSTSTGYLVGQYKFSLSPFKY